MTREGTGYTRGRRPRMERSGKRALGMGVPGGCVYRASRYVTRDRGREMKRVDDEDEGHGGSEKGPHGRSAGREAGARCEPNLGVHGLVCALVVCVCFFFFYY